MSNPGGFRRRWSEETKQDALALAADIGSDRAGERLEISPNTIRSWQRRESAKILRELERAERLVPIRDGITWGERRQRLLAALGELAEEACAAARLSVREGRAKVASDYSNVASRAIDKASLLGGGVTSRSESRSLHVTANMEETRRITAEIEALEKELESGG